MLQVSGKLLNQACHYPLKNFENYKSLCPVVHLGDKIFDGRCWRRFHANRAAVDMVRIGVVAAPS